MVSYAPSLHLPFPSAFRLLHLFLILFLFLFCFSFLFCLIYFVLSQEKLKSIAEDESAAVETKEAQAALQQRFEVPLILFLFIFFFSKEAQAALQQRFEVPLPHAANPTSTRAPQCSSTTTTISKTNPVCTAATRNTHAPTPGAGHAKASPHPRRSE